MRVRQLVAGLLGATLLTGLTLVSAPTAGAAPELNQGAGISVGPTPGGNKAGTWLGQYVVNGKKTFCVDYALPAPNATTPYKPGDVLKTKWGTPLPAGEASDISYLLLKYGNTTDNTTAAAVAHLLHTWTAPVVPGHPWDPHDKLFTGKDTGWIQRNLSYGSAYYLAHMPANVQTRVSQVRAEAAANRAPWALTLTPPAQPQINKPGVWTLKLQSGNKNPVSNVPVTLTGTQATLQAVGASAHHAATGADAAAKAEAAAETADPDSNPLDDAARAKEVNDTTKASDTLRVTTDKNGTAQVKVTPTGAKPAVHASLISPNALPRVQVPVNTPNVQKVVLGGGEQNLTTTFEIKPGSVKVAKTDAESHKGIAGVSLRVTGADGTSPAQGFDGQPLLGPDKKPVVVRTGDDGTVTVPNLTAPQQVCVIETQPAKGYEQGYDAKKPPKACGEVDPDKPLTLNLTNKANQVTVPVTIPAGGSSAAVTTASDTVTQPSPYGLIGLGAAVLLLVGIGGGFAARRLRRR